MNNPLEMIQMIKNIKNPRDFVVNYVKQNNNNPIMNNLIGMAEKNDTKGLEQFATNILKQQGMDFQEIMKNFK